MKPHIPKLISLAAVLGLLALASPLRAETPEGYAGTETCAMCHEAEAATFSKTPHASIPSAHNDGVTGCESCHGLGQAHADSGGDVSKIFNPLNAKGFEVSDKCLDCHEKGNRKHWTGSAHDGRGLSCSSCHKIHQEGEAPKALLAKATEFDTCTSCHLKKKGQLMRSYHMPMREKSMTCSSCHNAHGSAGPSMLNAFSVNDNCYQCHAEKRAPMMWEHAPVKEDCTICHDSHGSMHTSMLKVKQPRLCQQCHDESRHPTSAYGSQEPDAFVPGSRMFGHACLNCHRQIHGSNHPSGARFQR